jgi:hypothetical protein
VRVVAILDCSHGNTGGGGGQGEGMGGGDSRPPRAAYGASRSKLGPSRLLLFRKEVGIGRSRRKCGVYVHLSRTAPLYAPHEVLVRLRCTLTQVWAAWVWHAHRFAIRSVDDQGTPNTGARRRHGFLRTLAQRATELRLVMVYTPRSVWAVGLHTHIIEKPTSDRPPFS